MSDLPAEAVTAAEAELAEYLFGRGPDDYDIHTAASAMLQAAAPAIRDQAAAAERERIRRTMLERAAELGYDEHELYSLALPMGNNLGLADLLDPAEPT